MTGRPLLLAASVASLNAALLASASAETCVTGVNPTFANAVNDVSGQPGGTVVTSVTPTFTSAVTGVTTTQNSFLTSTGINQIPGTAVTSVTPATGNAIAFGSLPTGTVTGIIPTPGLPTPTPTFYAPAFATNFPGLPGNTNTLPPAPVIGVSNIFTSGAVTGFALNASGSTTAPNNASINFTTNAGNAG